MAFSYCATAISLRTLTASSAAHERASKMGRTTRGAKFHDSCPLLNRFESSALDVPNEAVREDAGKSVARAAPMFAFSARSRLPPAGCRAAQQHVGGEPGGDLLRRSDRVEVRRKELVRHLAPGQQLQRVPVLRDPALVEGRVGPGGVHRVCAWRRSSSGRSPTSYRFRIRSYAACWVLLGGPGQPKGFPVRGQGKPGVGDFRHQQDPCAAARLLGGEVIPRARRP
jgi:hypothetical protein